MYLINDTLLLADVFENFKKIYLKIHQLEHEKLLSMPGLAWEAVFKKIEVKSELLTDIDRPLMVEKGTKEEFFTLLTDMKKLIVNVSKIMIRMKNRYILIIKV